MYGSFNWLMSIALFPSKTADGECVFDPEIANLITKEVI